MTRILAALLLWVSANCPVTDASASPVPASPLTTELRHSTQALLDAIAPGDVKVWDRLLDEQVIQVDENDVVRHKKEILAELAPLPAGLAGRLAIDNFQVVEHGGTAVVTHEDAEYLDYHGQIIRSRFRATDTWIRTPAGWRLLASQALAVPQDPPTHALDNKVLCAYAGSYELTADIITTVHCEGDALLFERAGRPARHFRPELLDVFFEPGAPRTRRIFRRDSSGTILDFVDRREGRDVVWRRTDTVQ